MIVKNGRDLPVEQVTAENYIVPGGEKLAYHVKIEVKQFNAKTGEKISRARIQKFGQKAWEGIVRDSLKKQGYSIEVLHDPTEWQALVRARGEQNARNAEIAAKKKAEEEAAAQKAALKAEILAELKAEGVTLSADEEKKKPGRPKKGEESEVKE